MCCLCVDVQATIKEQRASHEREIQRRREEDEAEKEVQNT